MALSIAQNFSALWSSEELNFPRLGDTFFMDGYGPVVFNGIFVILIWKSR